MSEEMYEAIKEIAPWISAAIDDHGCCHEFRQACSRFLEAAHDEMIRRGE